MKATVRFFFAAAVVLAVCRCSRAYTPAETNRVVWQLVNMANPHVDDLDKMQRYIGFFDTRTPRKFFRLASPWKVPQ